MHFLASLAPVRSGKSAWEFEYFFHLDSIPWCLGFWWIVFVTVVARLPRFSTPFSAVVHARIRARVDAPFV